MSAIGVFADCPICGKSLKVPRTKHYTIPTLAKKVMNRHLSWTHPTFGDRDRSELMELSSGHIHETPNDVIFETEVP